MTMQCCKLPCNAVMSVSTKLLSFPVGVSSSDHNINSKPKKTKKQQKKTSTTTENFKRKLLANDLSKKILGDRRRCDRLQSLQEEFFVVSTINALLAQGMVSMNGILSAWITKTADML